MKSKCISSIMEWWFGKNKGKKSPETRGLCDNHPYNAHSSSSPTSLVVSLPNNHALTPASSSFAPSFTPPIAVPYEAPQQVINRGPQDVKFFAGGNENKEGQQEIDEVEVGNSANGFVSPIFGNNGGKIDIKVGNNINAGQNQKIGKVKFGNAG